MYLAKVKSGHCSYNGNVFAVLSRAGAGTNCGDLAHLTPRNPKP